MALAQAELDRTGPRFVDYLRARKFVETPSAPLTQADASVTFVNASITPFKPRLLAGERIGRTCQVQQCLRATGRAPYMYYFGMLGVMTDAEYLTEVMAYAPEALLAAAPWMSVDRLGVVVDHDHDDLQAELEESLTIGPVEMRRVRHEEVPTRWSYGKDGALTGRGLTFFYRTEAVPCGPDCAVGCRCGHWCELGQIIEVNSARGSYVEVGVGLELVQALTCGSDVYALPAVRAEIDRLRSLGVPADTAHQTANLLRAVTALVDAGVRPGGKGGANVMRRFVRELLGLLHADFATGAPSNAAAGAGSAAGDWRERVRTTVPDAATADAVIAEGELWLAGRAKAERAARSYLRRHPDVPADVLSTTYGLDPERAQRIRQEVIGT